MKCPSCGSEKSEDAKFCPNCGASFEQAKKEVEEVIGVYCSNCGAKLSGGAVFCTNCGTSVKDVVKPRLERADWGKRFIAWLIDIIILGLITGPWISLPGLVLIPELRWIPFVDFGTKNLINFLYWMVMESIYGQSIGKMVMKIKVTKLDGKPVDVTYAAIESIGKAFLLPIDCIIGWILYSNKNQRLFNYISETIVVRT
jgi:uncharacterized RDD family membrane protein YckC